jgi:methylglutaconyl-CoA hydratase
MTMLRRSVGEKHAFDLVSTGRILSADEAKQIGLVSRVFASREFDPLCKAVLEQLSKQPTTSMAATKALFYKLDNIGFLDGISAGIVANADARATSDFREGVKRFANRKKEQ